LRIHKTPIGSFAAVEERRQPEEAYVATTHPQSVGAAKAVRKKGKKRAHKGFGATLGGARLSDTRAVRDANSAQV
jgi:hypothetical protein